MANTNLYEENLALFSRDNPAGGIILANTDLSSTQMCTTKGELNVKTEREGKTYYFHSSDGPKQEAERWFSLLKLDHVDVIYLFGVGLGYYYETASAWLSQSPERHIVFLEDDLSLIHHFLHTELAHQLLSDPQAHLYFFHNIEDQGIFNKVTWKFCRKQIEVSALNFYRHTRSDTYSHLKSKLLYESSMKNDIFDEFYHSGAPFFRNFYPNVMKLPDSYNAQSLFGKFTNIPAIICGAGPSLKKNIHLLTSLRERALIFAGGSAMNALNASHVLPHFGAGIDPNPEQYVRYETSCSLEVPFFYRNRLEHRTLAAIHGPKLYVKGAGGYPIADWFDEALHIEGPILEEGHNVVNFCAEIAAALGCNPIIFVGLDLAYSDMRSYANGVVPNASVLADDLAHQRFELKTHKKKDIYGKEVHTLWKWIAESEWLSHFATQYHNITFLNATEGGIGIEGVENLPLSEVIHKYLHHTWDLADQVSIELQNAPLMISLGQIVKLFFLLHGSLQQSLIYLEELSSTDIGSRALAEVELHEEVAYQAILEVFENLYQRFRPEDEEGKYQFLTQTAQLNLSLIEECLGSVQQ